MNSRFAGEEGPRRSWDAAGYDAVSAPLEQLGVEVLDRLELGGDETVLDVGCGTGRVSAHLAERLPGGRVIAIDSSEAMAAQARQRLGEAAEVLCGDILTLELPVRVDAVVSTATFHWIDDHARLFESLARLLVPGGRLAAQCGGAGNIRRVLAAADEVAAMPEFAGSFDGFRRPSHFASAKETARNLEAAGFERIECRLTPRPVEPDDPLRYLATISLGPHLERLAEEHRDAFSEQVAARLGEPLTIDYVRLDIDAQTRV
jgi:trans-aconitate 2-methyltransferase